MAAPESQLPPLFGLGPALRTSPLGQFGVLGKVDKSLLVFRQQHSQVDVHFHERFLGAERVQNSSEKCFYYINENRNAVNTDFHLRIVFSMLRLNKDNLVSLFVNEPCEKVTVLPNIISILEFFRIHPDELSILKNCNFSLKVSKNYLNEYEEIKELISTYCKDSSTRQSPPASQKSPVRSPPRRQLGRLRKNLSQSLEILELPALEDSRYNLSRLLPPEKRFARAISDKSRKGALKRPFPGSKGPTLKRPLGVFTQMRKRALINAEPEESSGNDLSLANRSMLRKVLKGMEASSQKTRDFVPRQSGPTSQKSLTVKQTYSERKFNDFLAKHRGSQRESEVSFDQSARFTKKAKKSFCFKTIHSKLTNGFKKKLRKTFSLRSLHTRALRFEPKEPSFVPLDAINLNDLTYSFVQRESDRRKSFITVPHGQNNKRLVSITQESSGSEKSVQSLQTRPYRRRSPQPHFRSEEDFVVNCGDQDAGFLKDMELMKELDEEVYLNYMQQHLDYYEFLGGKESMAIIGHDFSKKQHNIDKINLRYRKNEHYYLPQANAPKRQVSWSKSNKRCDGLREDNSKKTKKHPVSGHKFKKAPAQSVQEQSVLSSKRKKKTRNKKKQPGIFNTKIRFPSEKDTRRSQSPEKGPPAPPQSPKEANLCATRAPLKFSFPGVLPQDSKPIVNSNVNTISWILKDSDTKIGSLVKENSDKESLILGISKMQKGKFVESQKVVMTEGLHKSQHPKPDLKGSSVVNPSKPDYLDSNIQPESASKSRKKKKKRKKNRLDQHCSKNGAQESGRDSNAASVQNQLLKNEKFASDLFIPKKQEWGLSIVNHAQNNLLSSCENLNEKIIPINISEKKIDQLNLLSEKSETEKTENAKPVGEKKKKRKRKKRRRRKRKNQTSQSGKVDAQDKEQSSFTEREGSFKLKQTDFLNESQDKKILELVSEFDQLTDKSQSEKMQVLRRGIEEFAKVTRPISPEADTIYNRINTDEKLLSLLALSKENEEMSGKKQKMARMMGGFEEDPHAGKVSGTRNKLGVMRELETAQQSHVFRAPFFEQEDLDCGLLSEFMDEVEDRQKFYHVEHFYLEKSAKTHKIVIIDPDLR